MLRDVTNSVLAVLIIIVIVVIVLAVLGGKLVPFPLNRRAVTDPFYSTGQAGLRTGPEKPASMPSVSLRSSYPRRTVFTPYYTRTHVRPPSYLVVWPRRCPRTSRCATLMMWLSSFSRILRGHDPICPTKSFCK